MDKPLCQTSNESPPLNLLRRNISRLHAITLTLFKLVVSYNISWSLWLGYYLSALVYEAA